MKRALLLSFGILVSFLAPIAKAQTPADCETGVTGIYRGTYSGDFSGGVSGGFNLIPGVCEGSVGQFGISFRGSSLVQFFFEDTPLDELELSNCFFDDLSVEGTARHITQNLGDLREFILSGNLDVNTCTLSGAWTIQLTRAGLTTIEKSGAFTMALGPFSREEVHWTALNGDFSNPDNWDPNVVPGEGEGAVFNQNQVYAVSFASAPTSGGFIIDQGFPTFLTGSYSATGGSEEAPSAIIGTSSLHFPILTLANHHLTTAFSTLGQSPGSDATVTLADGSIWTEQGRMVVGQAGSAKMNFDGASVTSMETQLGADASGEGTVDVDEFGLGAAWTTGSIAIGLRGKGTVNQFGGAIQSHTVSVGVEEGSKGTVKVGSAGNTAIWEFDGPLTVGEAGEGQFDIVAGGFVTSTGNGVIQVGAISTGFGTLRVDGAGSELSAPDSNLGLGVLGTGSMILRNSAKVTCDIAFIGPTSVALINNSKLTCTQFVTSGSATVILNNGTLCVATLLDIGSDARFGGKGLIVAPNAIVTGAVMPGAVNLPAPLPPKGLENPDEPIGTLTFGGNVNFGSATLEIEVAGLAEGSFDVIHATGVVDIRDSTVVFRFIDSFLPQTGDTVPFFVADGGLTMANLIMEFEGVADGFQFDVIEENGMLVFEALSDAQPDPNACHGADLDRDGEIDFIDLLIFIQQMNNQL